MGAIGTCPGIPVEGEVTACLSFDCEGSFSVQSTLGSGAFDIALDSFGGGGGYLQAHSSSLGDGEGAFDAVVDVAYLVAPDGTPDAGAVYCASGVLHLQDGEPRQLVLDTVARLGSCADTAGDGELRICVGH
jgi:hypothetical protein